MENSQDNNPNNIIINPGNNPPNQAPAPTPMSVPAAPNQPPTYINQGPENAPETMTLAPEKKKKSCLGRILLIILLLIILVPTGLVYATEIGKLNIGLDKYYNRYGLEKLWKGMPIYPPLALAEVIKKEQIVSGVHFSGQLKISGSILNQISTAKKKTQPKNTKGQVLGESTSQSIIEMSLSGDIIPPDKSKAELSTNFGQKLSKIYFNDKTKITAQTITSNNKLYIKFSDSFLTPGLAQNKWQEIDYNQYMIYLKSVSSDDANKEFLQDVKKSIKSYQRTITVVNQVPVYQYRVVLDKNILKSQLGIDFTSDPIIEISIGKNDHLIYQLKFSGEGGNAQAMTKEELMINFSDYNKPVVISTPNEKDVEKHSFESLVINFITNGAINTQTKNQNSSASRDATRKTDLASISAALKLYHQDNGQYPIAATNERTDSANSVLASALVDKYLSSIPKDPQTPDHYYGYKSDGESFQLSCILENTSDSAGKKVGNLFLYIMTK